VVREVAAQTHLPTAAQVFKQLINQYPQIQGHMVLEITAAMVREAQVGEVVAQAQLVQLLPAPVLQDQAEQVNNMIYPVQLHTMQAVAVGA
jgi:uncharacterized membrane-anchored protein YhcB (DUF1043 family)